MNKLTLLGRACEDARICKTMVNGESQLTATFPIMEVIAPGKRANATTQKKYRCVCTGYIADYAGLNVKKDTLVYLQGSMELTTLLDVDSKEKHRKNIIPVTWLKTYGINEPGDEKDTEFWKISATAVVSGIIKEPPRLQQSSDGTVWTYLLINNVRKTQNKDKRKGNTTIRVIAFEKVAYHVYKHYLAGDSVFVYGTPHLNIYMNEKNIKQEGWEIIVEHMEKTLFLDKGDR